MLSGSNGPAVPLNIVPKRLSIVITTSKYQSFRRSRNSMLLKSFFQESMVVPKNAATALALIFKTSELFKEILNRGLFRNYDLRVPLLNTEFTLERVPLSKSQNFAGSAEPMEPVLKRPL